MVETYCPPALIINDRGNVLWVVGEGATYLKRPTGPFSTELLQIIIDDLVIPVSTALHRLRQGKTEAAYNSIRLLSEPHNQWVNLRVRRIVDDQHPGGLILITFEPTITVIEPQEAPSEIYDYNKLSSQHIRNIQEELEWTKANLQATIQELETSNEEYQATNEELKASNQELHSSNEELHSVNQELYTVNAEYQSKFNELMALHNDIDNLLRSTDIGTIFLDQKLCIRKFTPAATTFVPLLLQDIGRPLNHLALTFADEHFLHDVNHVLHGGERVERELQTQSGTSFILRILPFMLDDGSRAGAVLRRCLKSLMLGNPSYHQVSHGDVNHRLAALREELIILVQSPVFVQPTECPLHPPPFGQNHKPFHVVGGLDNLETNLARASKLPHPSDEWPRLGAIGPNTAQAGQLMTQKSQ